VKDYQLNKLHFPLICQNRGWLCIALRVFQKASFRAHTRNSHIPGKEEGNGNAEKRERAAPQSASAALDLLGSLHGTTGQWEGSPSVPLFHPW